MRVVNTRQEVCKRSCAVTDLRLRVAGRSGERDTEIGAQEVRVIAESAAAVVLRNYGAIGATHGNDGAGVIGIRSGARVVRSPWRSPATVPACIEQRGIVCIVFAIRDRRNTTVRGEPTAAHSGATVERIDAQPGIVSDTRPAGQRREVARFRERILLEGIEALYGILGGINGNASRIRTNRLNAPRGEQRYELVQLSTTPRRDQPDHAALRA